MMTVKSHTNGFNGLRRGLLSLALTGSLALACWSTTTLAQIKDLTIALSTPVTTVDPHFHNLTPNNAMAAHVFETLVKADASLKTYPGLAESWKALSDTEWEFKLRKDVKWHNGEPFTAEDVAATIKRIPNVPNSPASFAVFVRAITDVKIIDPHTIRFTTATTYPLLPTDMVSVAIVPKSVAENAKTEDFNSGKAMIGTGPFRFQEYVSGDRIILVRNKDYYEAQQSWDKVTFRIITSAPARVAALLSGDVHMIEGVPTADAAKLSKDARVTVSNAVSNPIAAGQLLDESFFGTSKKLKPDAYDPAGAKKLMAEAGYPNGFGITLHSPNNRYINDGATAQAVAQFLSRNGIPTKVDTMPSNIFFTRASKQEFSFILAGWGASSGDTSSPLRSLLATYDAKAGMGAANRGRFSSPELDALIAKAVVIIDDTQRDAALALASEKAIELMGLIPLHYEVSTWATRKGISYTGRADQYTLAQDAKLAGK
ncbi:MAG: ABC transporter substrate-binding protein [Burkholderiales bacterium]|nr:ABC transporter substrate-binding protein [Burkholderiales bacterium]